MNSGGSAGRGLTRANLDQPRERANLDDFIYERLKVMIAGSELLPGDRIVPEQLARTMGVSRTPMLSALKRLSQEQLLEWRSRRGVFVRRLSKRELALTFELREVLEGLSARRAAEVIEPPQVDHFKSLFSEIDITESPENRREYLRQDYLFHSGLHRDCWQPAPDADRALGERHGLCVRSGSDSADPRSHGRA